MNMGKNKTLLGEIWEYIKIRKNYWMIPTVIALVLVGVLIIMSQSSAVMPFIYALF